jgi:hypothetical protein
MELVLSEALLTSLHCVRKSISDLNSVFLYRLGRRRDDIGIANSICMHLRGITLLVSHSLLFHAFFLLWGINALRQIVEDREDIMLAGQAILSSLLSLLIVS